MQTAHPNTPAADGNFAGEFGEELVAGTALGRFGEPEHVSGRGRPGVVITIPR